VRLSGREQIGTAAKSFAETAKPLFIGSIPIAASNKSHTFNKIQLTLRAAVAVNICTVAKSVSKKSPGTIPRAVFSV